MMSNFKVKRAQKFDSLLSTEINKIILHGKNTEPTSNRRALVWCYLKSFWSGDAMDGLTFDEVLKINYWKFCDHCLQKIVPLVAITAYNMISEQDLGWSKCKMASGITDSFTEECTDIAVNLFIDKKDFPLTPAIVYEQADDTKCEGIATDISNDKNFPWQPTAQYVIYGALLVFAAYLGNQEATEIRYVRIASKLDGVFLPIEDRSRVQTPFSARYRSYPYFIKYLSYFDNVLAFLFSVAFLGTLTVPSPIQQEWYVFPTKAEQLAYYAAHPAALSNWCAAIKLPIFLTYSQTSRKFDLYTLFQVYLFFMLVHALITYQTKIYNWMDPERYMNHKKRAQCSYYDIHENRNRVFNELMLNDWMVVHAKGPLIKRILTDDHDKYKTMRNMLSTDELKKLQDVSDDIDKKTCPSDLDFV
jgi:hypothetical protein